MTENEIQAFLTIVKNGSISAAAEELYLSQPTLSRRLSILENELNCKLFERRKGQRSIELTSNGEAFVSLAKRWQQLMTENNNLAVLACVPSLRIGCVGSLCNLLLPPVFQQFLISNPNCRLQVTQYHSSECYAHMEDGMLDLALISDEAYAKNTATTPAFSAHFYLVSQAVYRDRLIKPSDLNPEQEIRIPWTPSSDQWHDYWFSGNSCAQVVIDQMSLLQYFLSTTAGWALAPAYVAQLLAARNPALHLYQLSSPPDDEIIYYLQPKNPQHNNYHSQYFMEVLAATLPTLNLELTMML